MAKLFIVGFPKNIQEIELVEMFSLHGTVNTVTIVTDKVTGEPKGYAFITMTDDAGAGRAISALDGVKMGDRTLNVRFAEEKPAPRTDPGKGFKKTFLPKPPTLKRDNRTETPKPKRPRRPL
ncbi:RNA-binding protein [Mucilaginibacter sp. BJC16-A38]|uniref:RNA recognition motif domain-containing protein n=1 Tax=Mucilaginibacter phenanthrenivorans TaxID=1234842 RepID=UPI00215755F7|nr:RNA-binding protein [Mucilaginibacter phenanthrenivorans]MCR8557372.1 RNA-binding protein [Mucilaginibacter phenanthrenivorans]